MSASSRISNLVKTTLVGRKIDVVRFTEDLLDVVSEVVELRCYITDEQNLRFDVRSQESFAIELDAARAKLRMLCAHMSVLCGETSGVAVSPYGGEGVIAKAAVCSAEQPGTATHSTPLQGDSNHWTVRFKNTTSEQEFTLIADSQGNL